jgi:hypothetical protein
VFNFCASPTISRFSVGNWLFVFEEVINTRRRRFLTVVSRVTIYIRFLPFRSPLPQQNPSNALKLVNYRLISRVFARAWTLATFRDYFGCYSKAITGSSTVYPRLEEKMNSLPGHPRRTMNFATGNFNFSHNVGNK